jgi:hypothetical protein
MLSQCQPISTSDYPGAIVTITIIETSTTNNSSTITSTPLSHKSDLHNLENEFLSYSIMKLIIAASLVASAAGFGESVAPKFTPDKNAFA